MQKEKYGIISLILSILALFTGLFGAIFAIASIIISFKDKENLYSKLGFWISTIYLFIYIILVFFSTSVMLIALTH